MSWTVVQEASLLEVWPLYLSVDFVICIHVSVVARSVSVL